METNPRLYPKVRAAEGVEPMMDKIIDGMRRVIKAISGGSIKVGRPMEGAIALAAAGVLFGCGASPKPQASEPSQSRCWTVTGDPLDTSLDPAHFPENLEAIVRKYDPDTDFSKSRFVLRADQYSETYQICVVPS